MTTPRALIAQWREYASQLLDASPDSADRALAWRLQVCADDLEAALAADGVPSPVRNLLRWAVDFHLDSDPCEVERAWLASLPPDADAPLPGALAAAPSLLTDGERDLLHAALNPPDGVESWPKSSSGGHTIRKDCVALGVSYFDAVSRVLHDIGLTNAATKTNADRAAWLLAADARLRGAA
jgi:hypothetical protein